MDAHTALHLYNECLKGELMRGRTVILVSHHVALCAPSADYVVALDNGRVQFQGTRDAFLQSPVMSGLVQSSSADPKDDEPDIEALAVADDGKERPDSSLHTSTQYASQLSEMPPMKKHPARVLVEDEKRAVGPIQRAVWETYVRACGDLRYWVVFGAVFLIATLVPVAENKWLE